MVQSPETGGPSQHGPSIPTASPRPSENGPSPPSMGLHQRLGRTLSASSLRHYVRARDLKAAVMDWTEVLAAEAGNRRKRLAAELLASPEHGSTAARVRAFVERGRVLGDLLQLPALSTSAHEIRQTHRR